MMHSRFKGNHYDAGHRWGTLVKNNAVCLQDKIAFALQEDRITFAKACIPIYEQYFPKVLQEMQGICHAQDLSMDHLAAFVFGMYSFTLDHHCTCFVCKDEQAHVFARNSDFLVHLEKQYDSCYYNYDQSLSFIGNTTAFVEIEDGVNEYGFCAGLTFIAPTVIQPGFNAGMLIRYVLEHCKTVEEALSFLHQVPIASSQTITMADATGAMVVVECCPEKIVTCYPSYEQHQFVATANNFNTQQMYPYQPVGLDDWRSKERYQTASNALQQADNFSIELAKDILGGKYGFMCQYDRKTNADTVWSILYDFHEKKLYRVEGNPGRKGWKEDHRMMIK